MSPLSLGLRVAGGSWNNFPYCCPAAAMIVLSAVHLRSSIFTTWLRFLVLIDQRCKGNPFSELSSYLTKRVHIHYYDGIRPQKTIVGMVFWDPIP